MNGTPGGTEYVPWPEDMRRRVIFFSDEPVQGFNLAYDPLVDISMVTEDCSANKYSVGGFVSNDYASWHLMTDACNGWVETLSADPVRMREDLDYRFGSECGVGDVSGGTLRYPVGWAAL